MIHIPFQVFDSDILLTIILYIVRVVNTRTPYTTCILFTVLQPQMHKLWFFLYLYKLPRIYSEFLIIYPFIVNNYLLIL